jgi:hypothetical protein
MIKTGELGIMTVNPDFIAPCGLYCGVCAIYIAHRDNKATHVFG